MKKLSVVVPCYNEQEKNADFDAEVFKDKVYYDSFYYYPCSSIF